MSGTADGLVVIEGPADLALLDLRLTALFLANAKASELAEYRGSYLHPLLCCIMMPALVLGQRDKWVVLRPPRLFWCAHNVRNTRKVGRLLRDEDPGP